MRYQLTLEVRNSPLKPEEALARLEKKMLKMTGAENFLDAFKEFLESIIKKFQIQKMRDMHAFIIETSVQITQKIVDEIENVLHSKFCWDIGITLKPA